MSELKVNKISDHSGGEITLEADVTISASYVLILNGNLTSTANIELSTAASYIKAPYLVATETVEAYTGSGVAMSGETFDVASGTGAFSIVATSGSSPATNTGFLKIFIGSAERYIPYFSTYDT